MAPFTDLADAAGRQSLLRAASRPTQVRWTDPWLALDAARKLLAETGTPGSRRLIVLLTDGEPAPNPMTAANMDDARYLQKLDGIVKALAQEDTTLAVVLLSDQSTSCGRAVAANWAGQWARLTQLTPGGALYTASQAEELLPVYHAIVRDLSGLAAGGLPATTATLAQGQPLIVPVPVDEALAGLVITIWKAEAATVVQVRDPAGRPVTAGQGGLSVTGGEAGSREEVWRVAQPRPGIWQVALTGQGRISIWQDRIPLPTPTATVSATASASPTGTPTRTPMPTHTQTPTETATATPTRRATVTLTSTASATTTSTPQPSPTATDQPMPEVPVLTGTASETGGGGGRPTWPFLLSSGTALGLGAAGLVARQRRGPHLTGQLEPLASPTGVALTLPRDLGRERRRQVYLGRRGQQEWRLPGWQGTVRLTASRHGGITISPVAGEAQVDGQPLRHTQPLADGMVIGCGEYRIRYENLLA